MFPDNTLREQIENFKNSEESIKRELGKTPSIDFISSSIDMINGTPKLVTDIEAIKQWIILYVITPRDTYPIYEGTDFGTSWRKLLGRKKLNTSGYEESELIREITECLTLNPAIESVQSVDLSKNGRFLNIKIVVELFNGELLETLVEDKITFK